MLHPGSEIDISKPSGVWGVHPDFSAHPAVETAAVFLPHAGVNLVQGSSASRVRITQVEPAFFRALGVELLLGPGMVDPADGGAQAVARAVKSTIKGC